MTLPTCIRRLAVAAVYLSVFTLHAAPVAVNDSYSVSEDTLLATGGASLVSANFESPGNVLAGSWSYLDKIKNNQNGQTPDTYPLDSASRAWNSVLFSTATSNVGPWGSGDMPLQGGGINGFPGAPNTLTGYSASSGTPYNITTYLFRKSFTLDAASAAITQWSLTHLADDAAIFYVNGQEIGRVRFNPATDYVPAGALTTNTAFTGSIPDESVYTTDAITLPAGLLVAGTNVFAVELHQGGGNSNFSSGDVGLDVQFSPVSSTLTGGFTYADNTFGTTAPDAYATGALLSTGGNPGGTLNVSLQRADSPSHDVSGGWSRTVTMANAGTLRVKFDARLRLLGGFNATDYNQAVISVDGIRYGPVNNARGVSLIEIFGEGDAVQEIPGAWQTFTVDVPALPAGSHTIALGAFSSRPSDIENCQVYFDNLSVSVVASGTSILTNDTGGAVTAQLVATTTHGTLNLLTDGNFNYTPQANYSGPDSFTYRALDAASAQSNVGTVNITVNPVNDPPVAVTDNYSTNQQQTLTVSAAAGVLANDTDVDNTAAQLSAVLVTAPQASQGTVTLNANGSFTFVPAAAFTGPAAFVYRTTDGTANSADATVNITVNNVGAVPVATNDTYKTAINTPLVVTALVPSTVDDDLIPFGSTAVSSVWRYLDNGSNQGTLWRGTTFDDSTWKTGGSELGYGNNDEVTVVEDNPVPGYAAATDRYATTYFRRQFTVSRTWEITALDLSLVYDDGAVVYLRGSEVFRTATMTSAPADPPFDLYLNSSGQNNATASQALALTTLDEGLNTIASEIHQTSASSTDISFNLRLRATRTIPAGVLANDTDADTGTTLTVSTNTNPSHGTVTMNPNGTFTYTPAIGYIGPDSFTYRCTDGQLVSAVATVNLTVVIGPNVRPAVAPNTYAATEETTLNVNAATGVLANDFDADGDAFTAVLVTPPATGSLTLNANGSFSYTPALNVTGPVTFTYTANDLGGPSAPATVTINIANVNDAPVAANETYSTDPGVSLVVPAPGVLGNDTDPDPGFALTAAVVSLPAQGTLTLNANGAFNYAPPAAFVGTVTFTYRANDGTVNSNTATVTIRINGRPVSNANTYAATEDTPLTVAAPGVLGNDTDPENDPLTAQLVAGVSHGTLALGAGGGFTYTPAQNYNGPDSFTYKAFDGARDSLTAATVTLNVAAVNDAPVAVPDSYATPLSTSLNVPVATGVLANDSDVDQQSLTSVINSGASNGIVGLNPDGSFLYTPNAGFSGMDSFTYRASDGALTSAVTTVNIGVGIDLTKVVINEIHYHPQSLSAGDEFIEIFNGNPGNLDVSGWRLTAGVSYTLPVGTIVPGNGYLVIAANPVQFTATFAGVPLLRGPWTGELSNSGETIRLRTAAGETVDEVTYADEGDWAIRYQANIGGQVGWEWYTRADAAGSSLELINPALTNDCGQNWMWSTAAPTPGAVNSAAHADIAPLLTDLKHRPQIPRTTDPVTVTVNVKDESAAVPQVKLLWRVSVASPGAYTEAPMFDDGLHGDGSANDGEYGAIIPPQQPNGTVVEFFVSAADASSNVRTWPQAGLNLAQTQFVQECNAFYQVDEEVWANHYPIYRLIGTAADVALYLGSWNRNSDAQLNVTFVAKQGADTDVRYGCGMRVRGAGSRGNPINNWRLNIPKDNPWRDETEANLNIWHTHLGDLGSKLMEKAGMIHERSWPVQVRLNGTNNALNNSQYSNGYYIHLLPSGGEYLNELRPNDDGGNIYKKVRPHQDLTLREQSAGGPPNPAGYRSDGWVKSTNEDLNDWLDLHNLIKTFRAGTPTVAQMEAVMNVDYWLRWQAFQVIINHNETNLSNGSSDDFSLYRGIVDPRFIPLAHDFDTILGDGGNTSGLDPTSPTATVYQLNGNFSNGETLPSLQPIMSNPVMNQRFKAQLVDLLNTVFLPANFNPFVDSVLGDWTGPAAAYGVPLSKRDGIKNFLTARRTHILQTVLGYSAGGVPPAALTASTSLPVVNGYPQTTVANSTGLGGTVDSSRVRKVRINGTDISPDNYNDAGNGSTGDGEGGNGPSPWTAGTAVVLQPGINHLNIQALGPNDIVLAATVLDLWYDDGSTASRSGSLAASETWTAAGGPYQVTANLTVPAGVTLTIEPGATVFVASGATIQATGTGRILAEGTAAAHIRFTGIPGGGNWGALDIINSTVESRFVYCDFEKMAGTTVSSQAAMSHVNNAIVLFDHTTWSNTPAQRYLSFTNSSFIVSSSTFPTYAGTFNTTTGPEMIQGLSGIPASGYGIFRDNYFGHTWGANDTIEFTGGNRPTAILQVINNIFDGATDECLELDSTDAWIEGNVFMHVHQDTQRASAADTANAIGGGQDSAAVSEWTVINNLFYDVDHAVLAKNKNRFIFVNNTLAHVAKETGAGVNIAAFNFSDESAALSLLADGQGGYVSGNVIHDVANLVPTAATSYNPANITLQMVRNLFPVGVTWSGAGSANVSAPALLNTSLLPVPGVPVAGTVDAGLNQAAQIRAAFVTQQLSPAVCAGLLGKDLGALHAAGIEIAGEPPVATNSNAATLTVGPGGSFIAGSAAAYAWGFVSYKYSLDGGPYSAEIPVTTPLALSGLTAGTHSVSVLGKTDAGVWQITPTVSRAWTVDASARPVVISEVLARNVNAWPVGATRPDFIELRNLGAAAVDLGGWSISDDSLTAFIAPKYTFSPGTVIAGNGYLVLNTDSLGFNLNGDGDEIFLYSGAVFGAPLIDSIHFGFQVADKSLGRVCDDLHWALNEPTPGTANVITETTSPAGLRINEWLGTNDIIVSNDFLELYNTAPLPVDLGGLFLTDDAINFPQQNPIAPYSFIGANGFVRFVADGDVDQGANHLNFSISKLREGMALLNGSTIVDEVISAPQLEDVSQGRATDGASSITYFTLPTPGYSNSTNLTAQQLILVNLRITEMMYNPPGTSSAPEYVELRNLSTTQTLDLSGVAFVNGISFQFPPGTMLAPNAFTVITSATQAAYNAVYPGAPYGGTYSGKLDNGGERVRMEIDGYQLGILDFTYADGWYPNTDGLGGALEIVNAFSPRSAWDEKASWRSTPPNPGFNGIFGVLAGGDTIVCPPAALALQGAVTFGSQNPAAVTLLWTKVSGPGNVVFGTPNADSTTATFSALGTYVLRLTATGTVAVFDEVIVTAAESYDAWALRTLGSSDPLIVGKLRDPDKDGLVNLLEFALGLNPANGKLSGMPFATMTGGVLSLTYQRYTGCDVTYIVEASDNMTTWSSTGISESMISSSGSLQTWKAVDSGPSARRYMRVRVTAP